MNQLDHNIIVAVGAFGGALLGILLSGFVVGFNTKIKDAPGWFFGSLLTGVIAGAFVTNMLI